MFFTSSVSNVNKTGEERGKEEKLTLHFGHGPREDILLSLFLRDVLEHTADDALDEPSLLVFFLLLLEAHPAIEHRLDLSSERDALALNECIRFELCGLLKAD